MIENKKAYKILGSVETFDWENKEDRTEAIKCMQNERPIIIRNFPMGPTKNWKWDYLKKKFSKKQ